MIRTVFSEGFRIFFLSAAGFAVLAMAVWVGWFALDGTVDLPTAMPAFQWHAHEMIFGYGGAALGGFLLTAVPSWTGGASAPHRFIGAAFLLWLLGRLAMWGSGALPPLAVAMADLAFVPVLAANIATQLLARPKPQQMIFLASLMFLWAANLFCHLEWLGVLPDGVERGLRAGLLTLAGMITILGGRVTPGFTRNAMVQAGRLDRHPANPAPIAVLAIAPVLALPPALLLGLPEGLIAALALISGTAGLARVALWRGAWTVTRPILWTLHLSYGFNAAGLVAYGAAQLGFGSEVAALHLLAIGGVGGMTLAILSRATLGHSGRPLVAPKAVAAAYVLLPLAAVARVAGSTFPAIYTPASLTAGVLWLAAFALTLAALLPAWALPRPPRAPAGKPPA